MEQILYVEDIHGIKKQIYENYFTAIEQKYNQNPYHNQHHAADVTCSFIYFIMNSFLKVQLENIENLAIVIACLGHDIAHPGLNNRFLVNNKSEIAMTYNDISVLENMHSSLTFSTMKDFKDCDIMSCFND